MKNKTIRTSIIIASILIIGIVITTIYRTNFDIMYMAHKQIHISIGKEFEKSDIENIVKEVVGNQKVKVQKFGDYQDNVAISLKTISDEELENLNTKINEKYEVENTIESITTTEIPKTSVIDYIKMYVKPLISACVIIAIYGIIYYAINKGKK